MTAVTKVESAPVQISQSLDQSTMFALIQRAATDPSVDVAKMERLLALAEQMQAKQAKAEYDSAMNAAQGEMRSISRDCHNPNTRSRYASYEAIDSAIRPIYTNHGFSMSFGAKGAQTHDHVIVTCRISHRAGHTECVELDMPADGKGAKGNDVMTKTHATGSALSYAKRYIAILVWNLSFGDADDDGNAAGARTHQDYNRQRQTPQRPPARQQPQPQETEQQQERTEQDAPKQATDRTRIWMVNALLSVFEAEQLIMFAKAKGYIKEDEGLETWPLDKVATSKMEVSALGREIQAFLNGEPAELANAGK